jgi:hypothetical protein
MISVPSHPARSSGSRGADPAGPDDEQPGGARSRSPSRCARPGARSSPPAGSAFGMGRTKDRSRRGPVDEQPLLCGAPPIATRCSWPSNGCPGKSRCAGPGARSSPPLRLSLLEWVRQKIGHGVVLSLTTSIGFTKRSRPTGKETRLGASGVGGCKKGPRSTPPRRLGFL